MIGSAPGHKIFLVKITAIVPIAVDARASEDACGIVTVAVDELHNKRTTEVLGVWLGCVFEGTTSLRVHGLNPFKPIAKVLRDLGMESVEREGEALHVKDIRLVGRVLEAWPCEQHLIAPTMIPETAQGALGRYVEVGTIRFAQEVGPGVVGASGPFVMFESTSGGIEVFCALPDLERVAARLVHSSVGT